MDFASKLPPNGNQFAPGRDVPNQSRPLQSAIQGQAAPQAQPPTTQGSGPPQYPVDPGLSQWRTRVPGQQRKLVPNSGVTGYGGTVPGTDPSQGGIAPMQFQQHMQGSFGAPQGAPQGQANYASAAPSRPPNFAPAQPNFVPPQAAQAAQQSFAGQPAQGAAPVYGNVPGFDTSKIQNSDRYNPGTGHGKYDEALREFSGALGALGNPGPSQQSLGQIVDYINAHGGHAQAVGNDIDFGDGHGPTDVWMGSHGDPSKQHWQMLQPWLNSGPQGHAAGAAMNAARTPLSSAIGGGQPSVPYYIQLLQQLAASQKQQPQAPRPDPGFLLNAQQGLQ